MVKTKTVQNKGLVFLLVAIMGLTTWYFLPSRRQSAFGILPQTEINQESSSEQILSDFESVTDKRERLAVVLYKPTCPVCQKYGKDIVRTLEKGTIKSAYIDVSDGLPDYLTERINQAYFQGAKTPFVIILQGGNYMPIFAERINSSRQLEVLKTQTN